MARYCAAMTRKQFLASPLLAAGAAAAATGPGKNPRRINRAIELLEADQMIFYTGGRGGYEQGKQAAATKYDYINYEMEHGALDFSALRGFMQGLVDAGPTRSGHRTPAVIATLPVIGIDEMHMRANFWVVQQTLLCGVHGILLCHARDPDAIKWMVRAARYPNAEPVVPELGEGLLGNGSQSFPSEIWGVSREEYVRKADPWPLNPDGEFLLGLKIEDKHALANADKVAAVPGIGFAEWGPGDMALSLGLPDGHGPNRSLHPRMREARATVLNACKKNGLAFLNTVREHDVTEMFDEGVRIGAGASEAAMVKGRKYAGRKMPV